MATSCLPSPELQFLYPQITPKRRLALSKSCSCRSNHRFSRYIIGLRARICAVKEGGNVIEEGKSELVGRVNDIEWTGNGVAGCGYANNGSTRGYINGSVGVIEGENEVTDGSLVKCVNGNGVAGELVEDVKASKTREDGRKKKIEEIGKEEAWFKQNGRKQVEVRAFDVDCMIIWVLFMIEIP